MGGRNCSGRGGSWGMRSEIVADFGSSHGGSVILALDLVNSAKKLGFTAVQFQLSTASHEWCALINEHC